MRTLHRCMICSSLLHDTHTAVLINTAVLILHCRTIYQKKKPTGAIIPMSLSSLFTLLFFSTPSSSCQPNYLLRLLFLCFYGRKLEVWNEKIIGRLVTHLHLMKNFTSKLFFILNLTPNITEHSDCSPSTYNDPFIYIQSTASLWNYIHQSHCSR